MGYSVIAAFAILFIAIFSILLLVYSQMENNYMMIVKANQDRSQLDSKQLEHQKVEITAISVEGSCTGTHALKINASNKGSLVINLEKVQVLHDGVFVSHTATGGWVPATSVVITVPNLPPVSQNTVHRVKLLMDSGAAVYGSYTCI